MRISLISIFPEIYTSFLETSLIKKAQEKNILTFDIINPRDFCDDKHKQIDDVIYGGGAGMLLKAQPIIDSIESIITNYGLLITDHTVIASDAKQSTKRKIIFLSPSPIIFNQQLAYDYSKLDHIIFVSGRYEGIDYRFEQYMQKKYPDNFVKLSLGKFVTLGGELPSMVVTEAITRLIPGVIKEEDSHMIESYDPTQSMNNLEYPQYTRPEDIEGMKVPEVLLSGHHKEIEKWRQNNQLRVKS